MWIWLKRLSKRLLVAGAIGVIVLAIALGALRLALTQVPSYQSELKSWVAQELGLSFEFALVDARLSLHGPELTFHEASVAGAAAARPFLFTSEASITLDPWALLFDRELTASSLTLIDTRFTLLRNDAGLSIEGLASASTTGGMLAPMVPNEVQVAVRNSRVDYIDLVSDESWSFTDVDFTLSRTQQRLELELSARPPVELAERLELSIGGALQDGASWPASGRIVGDFRSLDLSAARRLLPAFDYVGLAGKGNFSLWLDWDDGVARSAAAEFAFANVVLAGDEASWFDVLDMRAEWSRTAADESQLTLNDVRLSRNGVAWPAGGRTKLSWSGTEAAPHYSLSSDFLRLQDLTPFVSLLVPEASKLGEHWQTLAPEGDVSELSVALGRTGRGWDYELAGRFEALAVQSLDEWPALSGFSGEVRADSRSGRVAFQSQDLSVEWPSVFRDRLDADLLDGILVWRLGRNAIRVVSDGLRLDVLDATVNSDLELTLPLDGSSPRLDLESSVTGFDLVDAKRLLPVHVMPATVANWVDEAVQSGRAEDLRLSFFGAFDAFPFDARDGQFRVVADISGATLEYIAAWPAATDLDGRVEFLNAGFSAHGTGRVLGNYSRDIAVDIPDMRQPVLGLRASTSGPLSDLIGFLQGSPLISQHLGPGYDLVQAIDGSSTVAFDLKLPLLAFDAFDLDAGVTIDGGVLALEGFPLTASEINGSLFVDGTKVSADNIDAVFLDGPVKARVVDAEEPGYRAHLLVEGETTATAVLASFDLPYQSRLAGQTRWQGRLQIPSTTSVPQQPVRIDVSSNLTGVASRFPAPLAKSPAEPMNLKLAFEFHADESLRVLGNLGATRRFLLDYAHDAVGYGLRRGAVRFGGGEPTLVSSAGINVRGALPELHISEWLGLPGEANVDQARVPAVDVELELQDLTAFGQHLGSSGLSVRRDARNWEVEVTSEAIAGRISVPVRLQDRPQIVADMQRLYLSSGDSSGFGDVDPRRLPGVSLQSTEFGIGERLLGSVRAEVVPDTLGLRLASFETSSDFLDAQGSGSWFSSPVGDVTRVAMSLTTTDVAGALQSLGFDPVIEGEMGDVTASVFWPGPPSSDWLHHIGGDVAVRVEEGSMLAVDPGAGRVLGLMSIVALPRRLALDFRDVFNKGLVFDEIAGDFNIIDGNAYTDNLKVAGPGAEIGVVGRTGLRDHDYEQQVVVTGEPGNILPTVGGLLGGAGVGAALLIFTRIFKEPLRGIGQVSYCITGTWDEPEVERLAGDQLEREELCASLPPQATSQVAD